MKLLVNPKNIDWQDAQSYYFFNPKHPQALEFKKLAGQIPVLKSHLYFFSSSFSKICVLSKKAFLFSAGLANQNLKANERDKWLIPLPLFHVSGLSILARCFLSGSSYQVLEAWDPEVFTQTLQKEKITLSSLVPSQVYDLIQRGLQAPKSLRAVLVGGDFISPDLYKVARKNSWPLLPCYGMSETGSHIACASLSSLKSQAFPKVLLLKGIEAKVIAPPSCPRKRASLSEKPKKSKNSRVKIRSPGLLSRYFDLKTRRFYDPKDKDQAFVLPDQLLLKDREILIKQAQSIKILGESLDLRARQELLGGLARKQGLKAYLLLVPDKRRGHALVLLSDQPCWQALLALKADFNKKVGAYERIESIYILPDLLDSRGLIKFKPEVFLKELGF